MKKGTVYQKFMQQIRDFHKENKDTAGFEKEFENFGKAIKAVDEMQMAIGGYVGEGKISMLPLYARRILTATSMLYGAWTLLDMALIANKRAEELGADHYDYNFYIGKVMSARYYLKNVVPTVWSIAEVVKTGDSSALEIPDAAFDY